MTGPSQIASSFILQAQGPFKLGCLIQLILLILDNTWLVVGALARGHHLAPLPSPTFVLQQGVTAFPLC